MEAAVEITEKNQIFGEIPCAAATIVYEGSYGRLKWANDRFFSLFGCTKAEYLDLEPNEFGFRLLGREYSAALTGQIEALSRNLSVFELDIETNKVDGTHITLHAEMSAEMIHGGKRLNVLLHDMSELNEVSSKNNDLVDMMFSVMAISADYIFKYDNRTDKLDLYKNVGGTFVNSFSSVDFEAGFVTENMVYDEDEETFGLICNNLKTGIDSGVFELRMKLPDDTDYRWYRFTIKTGRSGSEGEYNGAVGKIEDISTIKIANQRLIEKAERDPLTKLYNKAATKTLIQNYLRTDSRDTFDAFIIVDVDDFKQINDTLGHLFGDSVLVDLAQEMQDLFRSNDVIGRIGGDEFIVFLRGMNHKSHIASKAGDICKIFNLIYNDDEGMTVSGSLGIALFPTDGETFDELYRKADIALYTSKRAGKSCFTFYTGENDIPAEEKPTSRVERYQKGMDFFMGGSGFGSEVLASAFDMSEAGFDMNEAVSRVLEKVGKHFHFGRIVVSEQTDHIGEFRDTYIWRSKNAEAARTDTVLFSNKELNDFCGRFDKNFIMSIAADGEKTLKDNAYVSYLKANRIGSATICGFFRTGRLVGTVSVQDSAGSYQCSIDEAKVLKEMTRIIFAYLIRIREIEKSLDKAEYDANYDDLTGLMNYRCFKEHVVKYMETAFDNDKFVFLMADFTNFSYINSRFGHETGNGMLKNFAAAFSYFSDKIRYVCRVGSDRFCALAEYDNNIISQFESFTSRFSENENLIGGEVSFGIMSSAYIPDMTTAFVFDTAFSNVNLALRYSKQRNISKCSVYQAVMREELNRSYEIAADARTALRNNEFKVYFQPKVSISKSEIVGAEALVRWIKPDGTVLPPDKFIPFLEKNGYIVKIDYFVYEEVCRYLRRRIDEGRKIVPISVNVSRIHMLTNDFITRVNEIVRRYRIDPSLIEMELTESAFVVNENDTMDTMKKLKELGFKVSIDDFGTGYSSLSLLKNMPVDILKIDKGFFSGDRVENKDGIVLSSVMDMANKMNIEIICEGIETEEQVDFLKNSRCDTAQGFYYAKPVPSGDFEDLLENGIK
ncbi:MAG: EAL domain-containing protein [Ruminiclostridium sp.]|nr:EAL domain-containing protein [Ruminiclostridium sp.]